MMNDTFRIAAVSVIVLLLSTPAMAQLINRERAARFGHNYSSPQISTPAQAVISAQPAVAPEPVVQQIAMIEPAFPVVETPVVEASVVEAAPGEYHVQNRIERLYDMDEDGVLQPDEIADFYRDVVASVQRRGNFTVSSDLLKQYDANNDGLINHEEVFRISADIE